jgi:tetratricopeptide (TPR) repeat protein
MDQCRKRDRLMVGKQAAGAAPAPEAAPYLEDMARIEETHIMIQRPSGPARVSCVRHVIALFALVLALGACSNGSDTKTVAPDAKKASTALNAGLTAHAAGKLTEASADYEEALKYDHKNKFALYNLGLIDAANGNYGLAEDRYRVVLGLDPKYGPALFNLAILRTASSDSKEAMALYERAVAADPKAAAAWLNLGLLQRANGQAAAGDKNVKKAIALNPELKDPMKATPKAAATAPTTPATK